MSNRRLALFTAALVTMGLSLGGASAQEARKLTGAELKTFVSGNTIEGAMEASGPYAEYYLPDGTIRGKDYQGKWSVVADTLCFQYDPAKPADCWEGMITPANEIQWVKNGKVDGTGKAKAGNSNAF